MSGWDGGGEGPEGRPGSSGQGALNHGLLTSLPHHRALTRQCAPADGHQPGITGWIPKGSLCSLRWTRLQPAPRPWGHPV